MHIFTLFLLFTAANAIYLEEFFLGENQFQLIKRTGRKKDNSGIFCDINGIQKPVITLDAGGCVNIQFINHKSAEYLNIGLQQKAYEKLGQSAGKPFKVDEYFSAIPTLRFAKVYILYEALFGTQFNSIVELSLVYEYVKERINFLNTEIIHGDLDPRNIMVDMDGSVFFKNFQRSTSCFKVITGYRPFCGRFYETQLEITFGHDLLLFKAEFVDKFILAGSIIVRHDGKSLENEDANYLRMIHNVWNDFVWYLRLDPAFMKFGDDQGEELLNEFYASKYYLLYFGVSRKKYLSRGQH